MPLSKVTQQIRDSKQKEPIPSTSSHITCDNCNARVPVPKDKTLIDTSQYNDLTSEQKSLKDMVQSQGAKFEHLTAIVEKINDNVEKLNVHDAEDINKKLREEYKRLQDRNDEIEPIATDKELLLLPTLVFGDSAIKLFDATKLKNTDVACYENTTVNKLKDHLQLCLFIRRYRRIIIFAGMEDCGYWNVDCKDIMEPLKVIINSAIQHAGKGSRVFISSIPPCTDKISQGNVVELNELLRTAVKAQEAHFINNDKTFLLQSGDVNVGYLEANQWDLNRLGANQLAYNVKLTANPMTDICKDDKWCSIM